MKRLIVTAVILVFAFLNCVAQSNGGFENWHTEFTYEEPDDWQTMNFLTLTSPPNPLSAYKATGIDKHSGNYALKVKTIYLNNNPSPGAINDTAGVAFIGEVIISPPSYVYGFPYTGRPEKLQFWSKYFPVGSDSGGVIVSLIKWNGASRDTIAHGEMKISSTPGYTLFQLPLTYFSTAIPDSAAIGFASSASSGDARVGSVIYIDDVVLTGYVGMEKHDLNAGKVKVFPNPANREVSVLSQIDEATEVRVTDALGKYVGNYEIQNNRANINTNSFVAGFYFYEIQDKKGNILTNGKFNVVK